MSKSSIIESLLAGYIEGRLSPEEKSQFFDLLADSANESVFRNLLMKNIDSSSVANIGTEKEKDFSKIYGRIIQERSLVQNETMLSRLDFPFHGGYPG